MGNWLSFPPPAVFCPAPPRRSGGGLACVVSGRGPVPPADRFERLMPDNVGGGVVTELQVAGAPRFGDADLVRLLRDLPGVWSVSVMGETALTFEGVMEALAGSRVTSLYLHSCGFAAAARRRRRKRAGGPATPLTELHLLCCGLTPDDLRAWAERCPDARRLRLLEDYSTQGSVDRARAVAAFASLHTVYADDLRGDAVYYLMDRHVAVDPNWYEAEAGGPDGAGTRL